MWNKIKIYLLSCAIPLAVGGLSALLTMGNMDIYDSITRPPLAPPGILFPIVWTVLYLLMGISSGIIWEGRRGDIATANNSLIAYAASLVVNFAWSIIFFNFEAFLLAFLWLLFLLYLIIRTVYLYNKQNKTAALLQIPYIVWVAFAGYLSFAIWILN